MNDWRNIRNGHEIPTVNYCDQPYVAVTPDGTWICTLTTAEGREGAHGEFVGVTRSQDQGKTWSQLQPLEDPAGPESCYSVPFVTPYGRLYVFYNYNGDNFRGEKRSDELGWFVFRFSDDNGLTWSERHRLPMRMTQCDRENTFNGAVQLFWCVSHAVSIDTDFYIVFSKMKTYVQEDNEGWVFTSPNLLTESDPEKLCWELLPEGDVGIRADDLGHVQEEHNIVPLSDGSLYCMYRTALGNPAFAISRDGARSWSTPQIARYANGRKIKTPRACPMMWKTNAGKFLFWFHNNGTPGWGGRNPVWLAGGIEKDGTIAWSQPEIFHYDSDQTLGMSYPDLIEENGEFFFFHTQKHVARVVKADRTLLEALWKQGHTPQITRKGLALELQGDALKKPSVPYPQKTLPGQGQGLTIDLHISLNSLTPGQTLLTDRDPRTGTGWAVSVAEEGVIRFQAADTNHAIFWDCDRGCLRENTEHSIAFILDGGPKTLSVVVDGVLCDGGDQRIYGWCHFSPFLSDITGSGTLHLQPRFDGTLSAVRVYDRYLRTSEVIANHLASAP